MESIEEAATGRSHSPRLALADLPDHALDKLAAQLDGQARLSLSHTCRSLRQAGQRWFSRVRLTLSPRLDCAYLASWLRSHEGARACLVLAADSGARLLNKLTSDGSSLRGLAVNELDLCRGPEMDASRLRNLAQLTSLRIEGRRLNDSTDSLGQLTALQRLQLVNSMASIPSSLAALTGLTRLRISRASCSVGSQNRVLPQLTRLCELNLDSCGLAAVPPAVTALTALTDLDLSWNRLERPEGLTLLAALTQLRALDLDGNVCDIPEGLSALTGMTALRLSYTRPSLASLDCVLPRLVGLQLLVLTGCWLPTVPTAITSLTALASLHLAYNEFGKVEAMAPLSALTQLRNLNLGGHICDVPGCLSALPALTELWLDRPKGYPLCTLPPVVSTLTRLEVLSLKRAEVQTGWQHLRLLTRLRALNLGHNNLEELPQELAALQALEELRLSYSSFARGWQHLLALPHLRRVDLEVIKRSGTPKEVWLAERVGPVLARPHFLLATLLLCNSAAMEALPLFLDRLLNPAAAIILSVSAILVFGEILPQAVCKRYGLQVGAYLAWFVSFLMLLTAPLTWPIGKLLDWTLGEESALFKRRELKALVSIHADQPEDSEGAPELTLDEVQVIQGALDMASKTAEATMTPLDKVFLLPRDAEVNDELLLRILRAGHSRLPVYEGGNKQNIVGLVLVKELLLVDEDVGVRIQDLRLRELPFLSADTMLYDVLKVLRFGRSHMACLTRLEEASGKLEVVGIITIEDVLEELLQQEIVDETDQFVDNLQTVPTQTLKSLQQLPPHLRQFLTRNLIAAPPGGSGPSAASSAASLAPGLRSAQSAGNVVGAAAAAGAALAVSAQGGGPHAAAAAAATAATTVLLSPRRRAAAAAEAAGGAPHQQQKPPVPRRGGLPRGLRNPPAAEEQLPLLGEQPPSDGPQQAAAAATASAASRPAVRFADMPMQQGGASSSTAAATSAQQGGGDAQPQPPRSPFETPSAASRRLGERGGGADEQQPGGDDLV